VAPPEEAATEQRFIALAAAAALGVCLIVAIANVIVDPFGIYRLATIKGINTYKPAMQNRVRLVKAFDIRRIKPRALVLGTSRSHVAIRTTHPGWDPSAEPRYNSAFDGATTHEMYAYLRHAHAIEPVRQVVLGLDTWQLGAFPSGVRPGFDQAFLEVPGNPWRHVLSRLSAARIALSAGTALASLETVLSQDNALEDWFAPDGQRLGEVFFHRPDEEYMTAGPGSYFAAIDRQEAGFKLDSGDERPRRGSAVEKPDLSSLDYAGLIVEFCRTEGIDLRIFITPAHAHQMELAAAVGEWPKIEAGKRALVRLLAEDAARHQGAKPFPLYDFSGYSSVTTEVVPPPGSAQEMAMYWESSHFKEGVGDWVLDRLFVTARPESPVPADFGVALTVDTIASALAEIRAGRARYRAGHPSDAAAIRDMVAEVWRNLPPQRREPIEGAE
jgi:hypothetical protein